MANSLVQLRVDEKLRIEASYIFEKLGIDLSTAIKMFLARAVLEKGIPFPMRLDDESASGRAILAMKESSRIAQQNAISDMTLEEINSIIAETRNRK